jgi:hypothetical protein
MHPVRYRRSALLFLQKISTKLASENAAPFPKEDAGRILTLAGFRVYSLIRNAIE